MAPLGADSTPGGVNGVKPGLGVVGGVAIGGVEVEIGDVGRFGKLGADGPGSGPGCGEKLTRGGDRSRGDSRFVIIDVRIAASGCGAGGGIATVRAAGVGAAEGTGAGTDGAGI